MNRPYRKIFELLPISAQRVRRPNVALSNCNNNELNVPPIIGKIRRSLCLVLRLRVRRRRPIVNVVGDAVVGIPFGIDFGIIKHGRECKCR